MNRERFDRERIAVQDELKNAGQNIEIPDPGSSDYFNAFLALQQTHPRLAARLAEAGQADPAQVLDPYTPRPSKITAKHRWNSFVDKNFMRRGIDRKLVLDRQRVFRTGMFTLGGIVVAGLVWSVVAPKPSVAADLAASSAATEQATGKAPDPSGTRPSSTDTSGAFTAVGGDGTGVSGSPAAEAASASSAPKPKDQPFASDAPPQPVTTDTQNKGNATPPPPAVFNQVPQNDPYTPVASTPEPTPPPMPVTSSYADDAPTPIAAAPVPRAAPFGGTDDTPEPAQAPEAQQSAVSPPMDLNPPFDSPPALQEVPVPDGAGNVPPDAAPTPTAPAAPFGGETAATNSPAPQAAQAPAQEEPARGTAMLYQAQRPDQPLPKTSMMYQRPAEQQNKPNSAMIYQAQGAQGGSGLTPADGSRTGAGGSLTYQRASNTGSSVGSNQGAGGSLLYQGQPKPPAPSPDVAGQAGAEATASGAFAQTPDPDAPKFAPTSVIQGKLFSNIRTAAGLAVPVIVVSGDGNWVGVATYNTSLGRVDMRFTSFVLSKNGKSYPVDASAYQKGQNGTISEGVGASIHPIAPTLAVDLARAGINSLNTYTQALQNSGTTSVNGSLITTTRQAPELVQVVRGEIGKVFALPEGNVSIRIVADVAAGTDIQVVYGVSGVPPDQ